MQIFLSEEILPPPIFAPLGIFQKNAFLADKGLAVQGNIQCFIDIIHDDTTFCLVYHGYHLL